MEETVKSKENRLAEWARRYKFVFVTFFSIATLIVLAIILGVLIFGFSALILAFFPLIVLPVFGLLLLGGISGLMLSNLSHKERNISFILLMSAIMIVFVLLLCPIVYRIVIVGAEWL